jgi:plastocyanin
VGGTSAVLNLAVQIAMGLVLLVGMFLARRGSYRAHGLCQSAVVLLNLGAIVLFMLPMFRRGALSELPTGLSDPYYAVATAHAALGTAAEVLGLYVLLNAGTRLLPAALQFKNYRPWMRTTLALWWAVIAFGVGTYWLWNVTDTVAAGPRPAPRESAPAGEGAPEQLGPKTITISATNFLFDPSDLTIEAGDTVVWAIDNGRHTITADDKSFDTPIIAAGGEFSQVFDQVGIFPFYCEIHGGPGQDMAGVIHVIARSGP